VAEGDVLDFRMSTPANMALERLYLNESISQQRARMQPIMRSSGRVWAWTMVVGWKVIRTWAVLPVLLASL